VNPFSLLFQAKGKFCEETDGNKQTNTRKQPKQNWLHQGKGNNSKIQKS
jgi:hypothetical protein